MTTEHPFYNPERNLCQGAHNAPKNHGSRASPFEKGGLRGICFCLHPSGPPPHPFLKGGPITQILHHFSETISDDFFLTRSFGQHPTNIFLIFLFECISSVVFGSAWLLLRIKEFYTVSKNLSSEKVQRRALCNGDVQKVWLFFLARWCCLCRKQLGALPFV